MTSYRNTEFLGQQIDSLREQDWRNVDLWISRDCDRGGPKRIIEDGARRWRRARSGNECYSVIAGPRRGASANFLSMVHNHRIQAHYYAYCDHDDIWHKNKLSRAVSMLEKIPQSIPALYMSRVRFIGAKGKRMGISGYCFFPPGFRNALRENIANGCTMVFNRAARDIMQESGVHKISWHDWWTYLLISAAGGKVIYDSRPYIDYRLHGDNLTGLSTALESYRSRFSRDAKEWRKWLEEKLSQYIPSLKERLKTKKEEKTIDETYKDDGIYHHDLYFRTLRNVKFLVAKRNLPVMDQYERFMRCQDRYDRAKALLRSGVYHQKPQDSIELLLLTLEWIDEKKP
ncbi:MAG: glycosyltransferase [Ectothiorhodospiraceae bacterium AqS1]|nr:glycosyltransferase [Ectothiorhodospiraceae bacterium AqS1]